MRNNYHFFDSFPSIVIYLDKNYKIIYLNNMFTNELGYLKKDIIGKKFEILIDKNYKNIFNGDIQYNKDDIFKEQLALIKKNKEKIYIEINIKKQINNNKIIGYLILAKNFTEQKNLENELFKRQEKLISLTYELEESNNLKELFSDIMRHDLLGPLGSIRCYVEMILKHKLSKKTREYVLNIDEGLNKEIELINSAAELSKLENYENIEMKNLNIKKIIDDAVNNLKPLAKKANMKIINRIKEGIYASVNPMIKEVFINFLSNAIKYAKKGKKVYIEVEQKINFLSIKFIDFGEGILDEDKKNIFLRFKRKEKRGVKGIGLGLAIAKKIVELHNGNISVKDNPVGGSVFIVNLPKKAVKFK